MFMYLLRHNRLFAFLLLLLGFTACQKKELGSSSETLSTASRAGINGHLQQTKTFSSEVVQQWLNRQLAMFRLPLPPGTGAPSADRAFAYTGIALYEAVVPGMPAYQSLSGQLTGLPAMPETEPGKAYHWAASANAALAAISRSLFATTALSNKTAMDDLEAQLQAQYATEVDAMTLQRSINFGRAVAQIVWTWAQGDGTAVIGAQPPFVPVPGFGNWEATAAPPALPANPYHHLRRQMVAGDRDGAEAPALPFGYSLAPGSDYHAMAMEVYNIALNRNQDIINTALYHREGTGYGGGSSIAGQLVAVFRQANATLDRAALALAKVGIGSYEALTLTFIQKYQFKVMRPITYLQKYLGLNNFTTLYGTPNYPEYPAGHPTNGGMLAAMLADVFGSDFDVDYYNYLGLPPRHYDNFEALAQEMAMARVYAGIHYKPAVFAGVALGKKVAQNILNKVKFLKE